MQAVLSSERVTARRRSAHDALEIWPTVAPGKAGPSAVWERCPGTEGAESLHVYAATVAPHMPACSRHNSGALSPWGMHMPLWRGCCQSTSLCVLICICHFPPSPSPPLSRPLAARPLACAPQLPFIALHPHFATQRVSADEGPDRSSPLRARCHHLLRSFLDGGTSRSHAPHWSLASRR